MSYHKAERCGIRLIFFPKVLFGFLDGWAVLFKTNSMKIQAVGNQLTRRNSEPYGTAGATVRLRGLCLQDPIWQRLAPGPRLLPHGPGVLEQAKAWGANAVRIPFHPVTIRHAGQGDWILGLEHVVSELNWILIAADALDLDVIVDFHSIGMPAEGGSNSFFDFDEAPFTNLYKTDQDEIESFWEMVSLRFGSHPRLIAFEIFNEATKETAFGSLADWTAHSIWSENLIRQIIRPNSPHTLVIVSGLHFGYDLEFVADRPIGDSNVAYASHPYPHHSQAKTWDRALGKTADLFPVLLTELGFANTGFFGRDHHRGFRDWELEIRTYADRRNLSFFAWNFSHSWEPALLENKPDFIPNEAGHFFKDWLRAESAK